MNWEELISWLDWYPKIYSRLLEGSYKLLETDEKVFIEAKPFSIRACESEEVAKMEMIEAITTVINDNDHNIWVRVMPEINKVGEKWTAYARIAYELKMVTA